MAGNKKPFKLFFNTFVGEYVEMMTNVKSSTQMQHEDGSIESGEYPWIIHGYLLDEDDDYYFIGINSDSVNSAISKNIVLSVSISEPEEVKILKAIKLPENIGDLN